MRKLMALGWLAAFMALPVWAQETTATEGEPPAADAPPQEAIAPDSVVIGDEAATDEAAPASEPPPEETAAATESTDDSSASTEEASEPRTWNLYVGLEFDQTTVDVNDEGLQAALGRRRFDSDFYKLRLGARFFDAVGVEFHAGFPANNSGDKELETKQFYGLYLVPTGVLLDTVEVSARLGYAFMTLESEGQEEDLDGASFGLAAELPLRLISESMPNLRIGVGGTVYQEQRDTRVFGWHAGLRYDFTL